MTRHGRRSDAPSFASAEERSFRLALKAPEDAESFRVPPQLLEREYATRYLEGIGVKPNRLTMDMVHKHVPLSDACVKTTLRAEGHVSDGVLITVPHVIHNVKVRSSACHVHAAATLAWTPARDDSLPARGHKPACPQTHTAFPRSHPACPWSHWACPWSHPACSWSHRPAGEHNLPARSHIRPARGHTQSARGHTRPACEHHLLARPLGCCLLCCVTPTECCRIGWTWRGTWKDVFVATSSGRGEGALLNATHRSNANEGRIHVQVEPLLQLAFRRHRPSL
mmetsp:Transcript_26128/g.77511  ORF Transcript_26128/g.77511 Transcript_26128/m.77511 type:complete len:282 (-) Transcript_26128:962-1807(-)